MPNGDRVGAAEVLRALANGVDPVTGEVVDEHSRLMTPLVIRALFAGAEALERSRPSPKSPRPDAPSKAGAAWTPTEDAELRDAFLAGSAVKDLALKHERTHGAISARLARLGLVDPAEPERHAQ